MSSVVPSFLPFFFPFLYLFVRSLLLSFLYLPVPSFKVRDYLVGRDLSVGMLENFNGEVRPFPPLFFFRFRFFLLDISRQRGILSVGVCGKCVIHMSSG